MKKVLLALLFLSVAYSSCMIVGMQPSRQYRLAKKEQPFDAIIVPGIPFETADPWKFYMKKRVIWSVHLYKQGITHHIIYSGGAVYTPYPEALIMGLYAQKLGVPDTAILYDTLAQHGVENVYYSYILARKKGYKRIALATDQAQTYFLARYLKRFHIFKLPALNRYVYTFDHTYPDIDTTCMRVEDFVALSERSTKREHKERSMGSWIDTLFLLDGDAPNL